MLSIINNNPYRVLGVYSNSPIKDIISNEGKMKAFLKVGKPVSSPLDLPSLLPPVERNEEIVANAKSQIALPEDKVKFALFWFIYKTPIDEVAFNHLIAGNILSAKEIWGKSTNMSSLQNQFVLELICHQITESNTLPLAENHHKLVAEIRELKSKGLYGNIEDAINIYAIPLYKSYINDLSTGVAENVELTQSDYIQTIINTLKDNNCSLHPDKIQDEEWSNYIISQRNDQLLLDINSSVNEAIQRSKKNSDESLAAGNWLHTVSEHKLKDLASNIGKDSTQYQLIADKVAMAIIDCMVDYYNVTKDYDKAAKALPLCDYAFNIAEGPVAKKRATDNRNTVRRAFDNMAPQEVLQYSREIDILFEWFDKQSKTSKTALEFIKKAEPSLVCIKAILGKKHDYYLKTSSEIADAALSCVISEVNKTHDYFDELNKPDISHILGRSHSLFTSTYLYESSIDKKRNLILKIKRALRDAWQTIAYLDLFDKTAEFKSKRYDPNRETLHSLINSVKGFGDPTNIYSTQGCCRGIKVDSYFLTTDEEAYNKCKGIQSYNQYLDRYPNGLYADEIRKKIKSTKKRKFIFRWGILPALIIGIITSFVFIHNHLKDKRLNEAEAKGLIALYDYAYSQNDADTRNKAIERVKTKSEDLYNKAKDKNTIEAWKEYRSSVPKEYYFDSKEKLLELCFADENSAWLLVDSTKTKSDYKRYIDNFPQGKHISTVVENLVDAIITSGNYRDMSPMEKTGYNGGGKSIINIHNSLLYTMTLLFSGNENKCVTIGPSQFATITLKNGTYKIVSYVQAQNYRTYVSTQVLNGRYDIEYYDIGY